MFLDEVKTRLEAAFRGSVVMVSDMTGTGDHLQVTVVSDKFANLGLLEQHRLVYAPLETDLGGRIHALSIKTMTPEQWKERTK